MSFDPSPVALPTVRVGCGSVKLFPGSGLTIDGAVIPLAGGIPDEEGGGLAGADGVPVPVAVVRLGVELKGSVGSSTLQEEAATRVTAERKQTTTRGVDVRALLLGFMLRLIITLETARRESGFRSPGGAGGFEAAAANIVVMTRNDRELGLNRPITRRDFLNGVSVAVGGSLLSGPVARAMGFSTPVYPPALTGMRGSHDGSWEVAHELRDGTTWEDAIDTGESYDLVVVGGDVCIAVVQRVAHPQRIRDQPGRTWPANHGPGAPHTPPH